MVGHGLGGEYGISQKMAGGRHAAQATSGFAQG